MANKSTTAKVNNQHGQLTVQQNETDSPILPVAQLEQMHRFKPEAVDWVIQQTQAGAVIASISITGLAVVFLTGRRK